PELRHVDGRLRDLVRHAQRAALSLERLRAHGARSDARLQATRAEILAYLRSLPPRLDEVRARAGEMHRADARRELMAGPFASLWELKSQVDSAIEIAEL